MVASGVERLFFALWPSATEGQAMAAYAAHLECRHGRRITGDRLHLTLAFIGAVERTRRPAIEAMAAALRMPGFVLHFDRVGLWRRGGIVWAGCSGVPASAEALVATLRHGLGTLGLPFERRAFRPHVTLFRRASALERAAPPAVAWRCRAFVLVGSELDPVGARYRVLRRFALGSEAGTAYSD